MKQPINSENCSGSDLAGSDDSETFFNKNHARYFVPGLHRGLRVLEIVGAAGRPMSVAEVTAQLDLTRSSVFRLIYTLRHMGFLQEAENTRQISLGPRVLNLGFAYLASKDIIELALPELETLRDISGVSAHMAIRDERDVLYLCCVQTRSGFLSNMNVGARVPAYASPMGWVLLGNLTLSEINKLYSDTDYKSLTQHTPRNASELVAKVSDTLSRGFVVSRGVMEPGGSSISAPVFDKSDQIVAAINISGPDSAFDLDALEDRYAGHVVATAQRISAKLGHAQAFLR